MSLKLTRNTAASDAAPRNAQWDARSLALNAWENLVNFANATRHINHLACHAVVHVDVRRSLQAWPVNLSHLDWQTDSWGDWAAASCIAACIYAAKLTFVSTCKRNARSTKAGCFWLAFCSKQCSCDGQGLTWDMLICASGQSTEISMQNTAPFCTCRAKIVISIFWDSSRSSYNIGGKDNSIGEALFQMHRQYWQIIKRCGSQMVFQQALVIYCQFLLHVTVPRWGPRYIADWATSQMVKKAELAPETYKGLHVEEAGGYRCLAGLPCQSKRLVVSPGKYDQWGVRLQRMPTVTRKTWLPLFAAWRCIDRTCWAEPLLVGIALPLHHNTHTWYSSSALQNQMI